MNFCHFKNGKKYRFCNKKSSKTMKNAFFGVIYYKHFPPVSGHSAAATAPAMPNNNPFHSEINSQQHSLAGGSMVQSIRQGIANVTSIMPHGAPVPNLRKDLRRLGLEYTVADMSLSALYLHELHQRSTSSQNSPINHGNSKNGGNGNVQNYGLNDVSEEECVPLVEQA